MCVCVCARAHGHIIPSNHVWVCAWGRKRDQTHSLKKTTYCTPSTYAWGLAWGRIRDQTHWLKKQKLQKKNVAYLPITHGIWLQAEYAIKLTLKKSVLRFRLVLYLVQPRVGQYYEASHSCAYMAYIKIYIQKVYCASDSYSSSSSRASAADIIRHPIPVYI